MPNYLSDAALADRIRELVRVLNSEINEATERGMRVDVDVTPIYSFDSSVPGTFPVPTLLVEILRPVSQKHKDLT